MGGFSLLDTIRSSVHAKTVGKITPKALSHKGL